MKKKYMLYILLFLSPLILYGLYVITVLSYGTLTDFKPKETIALEESNTQSELLSDSSISFLSWNVGYGGLGYKADFFLDGGTKVRSAKLDVSHYITGISKFLDNHQNTDFVLLQEVDKHSKRSYFINQFEKYSSKLSAHSAVFAENFKVNYIPVPLTSTNPLGRVHSGLASFSKYKTTSHTRLQFPGEYEWPKRIFHLDRCMLVSRIALTNEKELVVVNSHNSAYDGGKLKPLEMEFLKTFLLEEYKKGNYVVVGADWNQCPPKVSYDLFAKKNKDDYFQSNIAEDFLPEGWQWVFDTKTPTNRKLAAPYKKDSTFTTLIDFYLVSPNVAVQKVETVDLDFEFSDHQPVYLEVKLK